MENNAVFMQKISCTKCKAIIRTNYSTKDLTSYVLSTDRTMIGGTFHYLCMVKMEQLMKNTIEELAQAKCFF